MCLIKSKDMFDETASPFTISTIESRPQKKAEQHRHEYYEMIFVEQGSLSSRIADAELEITQGDLMIMKPYVLHCLEDIANEHGTKVHVCSFLPQIVDGNISTLDLIHTSDCPNKYFFKAFQSLTEENAVAVRVHIEAKKQGEFLKLIQELQSIYQQDSGRAHALTRNAFLALLLLLTEQYERCQDENSGAMDIHSDASTTRGRVNLRSTLNYIHDHLNTPLNLESMAAKCGTTAPYFCRLFKKETDMTFLNYLNHLRIERARILLRDTQVNALDVCYQVGFNNYPNFNRQFKKRTGLSPTQFRKQKRGVQYAENIQKQPDTTPHFIAPNTVWCIPA